MRRVLVIMCCLGAALAMPGGASGAGGPVPPQQAGAGASAPDGLLGYVAVSDGRSTIVERIRRGTGVVERVRRITGSYGVPGVGYDGSTTGLSADGSTLVLAEATRVYPVRVTRLVVLRPSTLRPLARIALRGWWSVDAISPDGRWMYLLHYTSVSSTNHYEVRAYDLRARRLVAKPVIDPTEPDEKMQGLPMTRVMSADGRWAYTLYQRPDDAPFIHALDTQGRTARCIDLDQLTNEDVGAARLSLSRDGGQLRVTGEAGPLLVVDTSTFAVGEPAPVRAPAAARPASAPPASDGGGGVPWWLAFVALVPLVGTGVVAARRRRRVRSRH
jgi:hypothetical protein